MPVLFRGGWNALPAASHPLLKVLVLLKIYTWSFHGKIITGTLIWAGGGACKNELNICWLFSGSGCGFKPTCLVSEILDGLPDPGRDVSHDPLARVQLGKTAEL